MKSIAEDFDKWADFEDEIPTKEWAHPLDKVECELCNGPCGFVTEVCYEEYGGESG